MSYYQQTEKSAERPYLRMETKNSFFRKLPTGEMAVESWPDITFPVSGFVPEEGIPYTYTKVRHPEQKRFVHDGRNYVVCTATPVAGTKPLGTLADAFAGLKL
jgi:hypothetical protein